MLKVYCDHCKEPIQAISGPNYQINMQVTVSRGTSLEYHFHKCCWATFLGCSMEDI